MEEEALRKHPHSHHTLQLTLQDLSRYGLFGFSAKFNKKSHNEICDDEIKSIKHELKDDISGGPSYDKKGLGTCHEKNGLGT